MNGKVFVVTQGDYSSYSIARVYSEGKQRQAETYARLIDGDVEEFPLDKPVPMDPGLDFYDVYMRKDGKASVDQKPRLGDDDTIRKPDIHLCTYLDCSEVTKQNVRKSYWLVCWSGYAKDEEHAVRAANEIRRQILAGQRPEGVDMGKN